MVLADTAGNVTETRLKATLTEGADWPAKGGNARGQHFSVLDQINADNVADLGLAWVTDIPAPDGIAATPIVVDGVLYISAAYSMVYALDAANGDILWSYDPRVRDRFAERPGCRGRRGPAAVSRSGAATFSQPRPTAA